jgi:hypothetical protein
LAPFLQLLVTLEGADHLLAKLVAVASALDDQKQARPAKVLRRNICGSTPRLNNSYVTLHFYAALPKMQVLRGF